MQMNELNLIGQRKTPHFNFCIGCVFGIAVKDLYRTYEIVSVSFSPHVYYFAEVYRMGYKWKRLEVDGKISEYKKAAPDMERLMDDEMVMYEGQVRPEELPLS
jgi:hypothetical protein